MKNPPSTRYVSVSIVLSSLFSLDQELLSRETAGSIHKIVNYRCDSSSDHGDYS